MPTTFGCDCEFVLTLHGKYKSAIPVLKGTREKRERVNGNEIFHDNVLAEVAIKYGSTFGEVKSNFASALKTMSAMVNPCKLNLAASADYPRKELQDEGATEAGCVEETDAYTRITLPSQEEAIKKTPFRTAGGHIHLGGDSPALTDSILINMTVYALDLFVGIPSVLLDNNIMSQERRRMYGRAGSYREKPYGLEYRVLSPFWLRSPSTVELVYDLCMFTIDFVSSGKVDKFWYVDREKLFAGKKDAYHCSGYDKDTLVRTINQCDVAEAEKFMMILNHQLPSRLNAALEREISDAPDFYKSWGL